MDWIPIEPDIPALTYLQKRIIELQEKGYSNQLIASTLRLRSDHLAEEIYLIRKREAIMAGKLTNTQRAAIYQAWKDGTTPKELAKQYGVCDQSIYNLINKLNKAEKEIRETPAPAPAAEPAEPATTPAAAETENAEEISKNAEPEKIPDVVWNAIDDQICALNLEIEAREQSSAVVQQRLAELRGEIAEREAKKEQLRAWLEAHT